MTDHLQARFFARSYLVAGIIVGVAATGMVAGGLRDFALGLVAGALIGLVMIHGTVVLGSALVSRAQPQGETGRSMKGLVAVQIAKYVVGIGALYVLVVMTHTSPPGIAAGYSIPLATMAIMGARVASTHKQVPKDY